MPWEEFSFLFNNSDDLGIILYGDKVRWLVKYSAFLEYPERIGWSMKIRGKDNFGPGRTHNRIRSPRLKASGR